MNEPAPGFSPYPDQPQTAAKAYWGAAVSFIGAFLTSLLMGWTDTDPLQARDLVVALAFALGTGALTGGVTYGVRNKPKR